LSQNVNLFDLRVDAITDGNIDQAVFAGEGNGRFGAKLSQRIEPGAGASAQDDG
jgi:hypothetical protein